MNKLSHSRLNEFIFYFHAFFYMVMVYLALNFNQFYKSLDREDGFIELSGAVFLLFASIVLFKTTLDYKKNHSAKDHKFWLLAFAAIAFFWASGEEISWGQHMLGTETPEWLSKINGQNETNLHNINKKFFDRMLERLMVLLSLITAVQHFRGKEYFLGFKLPEYPLNFAYLLIPIFRKHEVFALDVWHLNFIVFWGYPILAVINKQWKILALSLLFILSAAVVYYFHYNYNSVIGVSNFYHEVRETIFSLVSFIFAIQLMRDFRKHDEVKI